MQETDAQPVEDVSLRRVAAPWHLWAVGVLTLLWNGFSAYDYVMIESHNAGHLANFTAEQIAYFDAFPAWLVAAWAIAVWGGVAGSILLLLRSRLATPVYALTLAALCVSSIYMLVLTEGLRVMGAFSAVFSAILFTVAVFELLYALLMQRKRVLR